MCLQMIYNEISIPIWFLKNSEKKKISHLLHIFGSALRVKWRLLSSGDNLYKPFGPRSGRTKRLHTVRHSDSVPERFS